MGLIKKQKKYERIDAANQAEDEAGEVHTAVADDALHAPEEEGLDRDSTGLANPPIYDGGIKVTLLDSAQSKFIVHCDKSWTVLEFKEASCRQTKVVPNSQRLIHMGKLLQDDETLDHYGIKDDGKIIHLFARPNVVIRTDEENNSTGDVQPEEGSGTAGAHVPRIVIDEDEANRRSQILILSSQEIFEAQHRVKIFSFLLMVISSMELLTLMTLFVGIEAEDPYSGQSAEAPPGNPTDQPADTGPPPQMRVWQNSDYFDTAISAFGLYVSLLGIKATTENTRQLAVKYFVCLVIVGVASNCYYYYLNVTAEERLASEGNKAVNPASLYTDAFMGILLPMIVWLLCIIRAYEFQRLIREAENEAEERVNAQDSTNDESTTSVPYGTAESLQVERGEST